MRIQENTCIRAKINSPRIFSCMYWFCAGGYSRWGSASKNKSKKPWASIFTLSLCVNRCRFSDQQVLNVVPKRGSVKSAGKRQESATFPQCSFFIVAVQFFICCSAAFGRNAVRTAEKPMLQCNFCSASLQTLQRNFCFSLWHVGEVGFRGVGFMTC